MNAHPATKLTKKNLLGCIVGLLLNPLIFIFVTYFMDKYRHSTTPYEECQIEMQQTGMNLDCEDDDADWYKKKKVSKYSAIAPKSSSKSGFGMFGSSSSGG
jgi:hypothetical protein